MWQYDEDIVELLYLTKLNFNSIESAYKRLKLYEKFTSNQKSIAVVFIVKVYSYNIGVDICKWTNRTLTWPCCLRVVSVSLSQHRHSHNSSDFLMTSGQPCAPCPGTCPCLRWDAVQPAGYSRWYVSVTHHQYQHLCRAKSHWNPHQGMLPHRLVAGTEPSVLLLRARRSTQIILTIYNNNLSQLHGVE